MMTYEVFATETNLASLQTTVRFRVWRQLDTLHQLVDECKVTLDGRYDIDATGLDDEIEAVYTKEVINA